VTFAPGCACEHWTLVGHPADAYHYDDKGELTGHHPDCEHYVAPTPEEREKTKLDLRFRKTVRDLSDFVVQSDGDGGSVATLNWRRDTRRIIAFRGRFQSPNGEQIDGPDKILIELEPGEALVIRTPRVPPSNLLRFSLSVDNVVEVK
jgi:hypothetical protein